MNEAQMKKFFQAVSSEPDYLPEYFTWWDNVTSAQVKEYVECLEKATSEAELQAFFETYPNLLIQHLGGGHGRWVIPQKKLGSELVTDFVIGERHSYGFEWQAVELESPLARLFTKKGVPSAKLTLAIRQIPDWRVWIKRNQDYASRRREAQGLGLIDIDSYVRGQAWSSNSVCRVAACQQMSSAARWGMAYIPGFAYAARPGTPSF